jgi:hypothetical protein
MPRGKRTQTSALPPATQGWPLKVEAQNRLRLPATLGDVLSWLDPDAPVIECVGLVGPFGGVVIAPPERVPNHERILKHIQRTPLTVAQITSRLANYARLAACSWQFSLSREQNRYCLTLREEPRKLGLLPGPGEFAYVFASGELLEVWPAGQWLEHIRSLARDRERLGLEALEEIREEEGLG